MRSKFLFFHRQPWWECLQTGVLLQRCHRSPLLSKSTGSRFFCQKPGAYSARASDQKSPKGVELNKMRVAVVGGSRTGLLLARLLQLMNVADVTVFERRPEKECLLNMQRAPWFRMRRDANDLINEIGLLDDVAGVQVDASNLSIYRNTSKSPLVKAGLPDFHPSTRQSDHKIDSEKLVRFLAYDMDMGTVLWNTEVSKIVSGDPETKTCMRVVAKQQDTQEGTKTSKELILDFDVVVGADGMDSTVRRFLSSLAEKHISPSTGGDSGAVFNCISGRVQNFAKHCSALADHLQQGTILIVGEAQSLKIEAYGSDGEPNSPDPHISFSYTWRASADDIGIPFAATSVKQSSDPLINHLASAAVRWLGVLASQEACDTSASDAAAESPHSVGRGGNGIDFLNIFKNTELDSLCFRTWNSSDTLQSPNIVSDFYADAADNALLPPVALVGSALHCLPWQDYHAMTGLLRRDTPQGFDSLGVKHVFDVFLALHSANSQEDKYGMPCLGSPEDLHLALKGCSESLVARTKLENEAAVKAMGFIHSDVPPPDAQLVALAGGKYGARWGWVREHEQKNTAWYATAFILSIPVVAGVVLRLIVAANET